MVQTPQKNKILLRQLLPFWVVLAAVCAVCMLPYANSDLAAGHDALFHLLRIEGLASALKGGAGWPVRVYSLICGGYGYAAGLFYPDVFLLFPAVLRAFFLGPELALKAYLLLIAAETCVTCYFCGKNIGKSRLCGLLLMALYGLCHYHLANLFIRSAVGEFQAMAFVPLVVWGLYDLTEQAFSRPWVLCLAFTGLMLSHTISLALCGLFALGWVLVRLPRVLHLRTMLRGAAAVAVCLLLSAFFWAPMLEQFLSASFKVSGEPLTHLQENTVPLSAFWDLSDFRSPGFGCFALAAAGVLLIALLWRRGGAAGGTARFGAALLAVWALLAVCILQGVLPWAALDKTPLASIQFPWRLNMLGQFCLALGTAVLAAAWAEGMRRGDAAESVDPTESADRAAKIKTTDAPASEAPAQKITGAPASEAPVQKITGAPASAAPAQKSFGLWRGAAALLAAAVLVSAANAAFLWRQLPELCNYPANYFALRGETFYLVGQEWLPMGVNLQELAAEPDAQYTDSAGAHTGEYLPNGSFAFADDGAPGLRGIPKIYYKGYTAWKTLADGSRAPLELHPDGANRVELVVPDGLGAGAITVAYTGTAVQKLSGWVSGISLLATLAAAGWAVWNTRRRKNTSAQK